MNLPSEKPPNDGKLLFENLFLNKSYKIIIDSISNGLNALINNASRLLDDTNYLLKEKRYASASFLVTTAKEEMAKIYILLDMCKLNFERHKSVLKRLCSAFYDHIKKFAYYEINTHPNIHNLDHARQQWDYNTTKWWLGNKDPEDYEPDLPHEIVFGREFALYVEKKEKIIDWYCPKNEGLDYFFKYGNALRESETVLKKLKKTATIQLFSSESLLKLYEVFKNGYYYDFQHSDIVKKKYEELLESLIQLVNISQESFRKSEIVKWPLYHFVTVNRYNQNT